MILKETKKQVNAMVWMAELTQDQDFPAFDELLAILDLIGISNKHIQSLLDFLKLKLPKGIPMRIGNFYFKKRIPSIEYYQCPSHI